MVGDMRRRGFLNWLRTGFLAAVLAIIRPQKARSTVLVPETAFVLLGSLIGADFSITTDQPISINIGTGGAYIVRRVTFTNASVSMTAAVGGIYTGAGKTGNQIVAATFAYAPLTTSSKYVDGTLGGGAAGASTDIQTAQTLFLSLTTAQDTSKGHPSELVDVWVWGDRLKTGA